MAQPITLSTPESDLVVEGEVLGYDGRYIRLDTIYGEISVDGKNMHCSGTACPDPETYVHRLAIWADTRLGKMLLPALIEGFARRNRYRTTRTPGEGGTQQFALESQIDSGPVGIVVLHQASSSRTFEALIEGRADLALTTREVRANERRAARATATGDLRGANRSQVAALDAIVPVVAASNPVSQISVPQLSAILAGQLTNWRALGGPDAPIALHLPEPGSGMAQAIEDRLLRAASPTASEVTQHDDLSAIASAVMTDPHALGLTSYAEVGYARTLELAGECGFAQKASRDSIKTEDYPLTTPAFVYYPARRMPDLTLDFLQYLRSATAQNVIRRAGFIDQATEAIPLSRQGNRLANAIAAAGPETTLRDLRALVETLTPMQRLTTSFRFEAGSAQLDAQSRSNVHQLARALHTGRYDRQTLLFAGFSDRDGSAAANRLLALRRAETVRDAVIAAAVDDAVRRVRLDVTSFGEALPMACDDSPAGRQSNRRVEVWIE